MGSSCQRQLARALFLAYIQAMLRAFIFVFFIPVCLYAQSQRQWVDSVYNVMTLDQKIGQLFMVMAFPDGNLDKQQNTTYKIKKYHLGGILFSTGTASQQLRDTYRYQKASKIPLLIAADAEWGMAMRLKDVTPYPYAMTLGALPNEELIYDLGKRLGVRKRKMDVHVTFSPVADVNTESQNPIIGIRAFGDNPKRVAKQAKAFMEGLQDAGIIAVAKHFPGHGAAKLDSHKGLPKIEYTKNQIDSIGLVPFINVIEHGVKGIMLGHLEIPSLDNSSLPVSVSYRVITELLQDKMNFNGLVFSDALDMKGITTRVESPAVSAFLAGVDVLLMPLRLDKAINEIKSSYTKGNISPDRLETSVKKILAAKYASGLHQKSTIDRDENPLHDTFYDNYLREQIAMQSIVKVYVKNKKFPLHPSSDMHYVAFGKKMSDDFFNVIRSKTQVIQVSKQQIKATDFSTKTLIVGIHTNTSSPWSSQSFSVDDISILSHLSTYPNVHVVLFANPYALSQIPNLSSFASVLLAHEQQAVFAKAAAQVLFGEISAIGILPVQVKE